MLWWLLLAALAALDDYLLGLLLLATVGLTQIESPTLLGDILPFRIAAFSVLSLRNLFLVSACAVSLWRRWRLPVVPSARAHEDDAQTERLAGTGSHDLAGALSEAHP